MRYKMNLKRLLLCVICVSLTVHTFYWIKLKFGPVTCSSNHYFLDCIRTSANLPFDKEPATSQNMEENRYSSKSLNAMNFFTGSIYTYSNTKTKDPGGQKHKESQPQNGSPLLQRTQDGGFNFTYVKERNIMRTAKVMETCKALAPAQSKNSEPIMRAIMDPNHRITYCRVNKVASTYTLALLSRTFNRSVEQLQSMSIELHHLPYTKMRKIISNSYTLTFVREPYGRLFSTYGNKFYFPKNHWAPIGPIIVKRYRNKPSLDSLKYGHNITFHEIIRYTVEEYEAGRHLDEHLRPMNARCYPCDYRYDFIGKLETLESDWTYLKHVWSTKKHINIPKGADNKTSSFSEMKHVLKTFDIIKDSTISRYKLYLRAWSYFQLTGLIYKHINMPFGESSVIQYDDFLHELDVATKKSKPYAEEIKRQKTEAIKQAYASVPLELLERLSKVVAFDCLLYGYENKPDWIFNKTSEHSDFNYFKGLE